MQIVFSRPNTGHHLPKEIINYLITVNLNKSMNFFLSHIIKERIETKIVHSSSMIQIHLKLTQLQNISKNELSIRIKLNTHNNRDH